MPTAFATIFLRKMRGFRRKPTEENSQERISGQKLTSQNYQWSQKCRPGNFFKHPGQTFWQRYPTFIVIDDDSQLAISGT